MNLHTPPVLQRRTRTDVPRDPTERARVARWDLLTYTLALSRKGPNAAWMVARNVQELRAQRAGRV